MYKRRMVVKHWEWVWPGRSPLSECLSNSSCMVQSTVLTCSRQTSMSSGILLEMGKGFNASVGVLGQDLGDLLLQACKRKVGDTLWKFWIVVRALIRYSVTEIERTYGRHYQRQHCNSAFPRL